MIEYKSREVFTKLIYIITISMAVIGVLFIPQIIFSRVKLSKTIQEKQSIEIAKTELVSEKSLIASKKVTSRSSEDIRKSRKGSEEEKAVQMQNDDNKNLVDNAKKENKAESKKENKKDDAKKENNEYKASKKENESEKQETKQKETKKDNSKDVAKTNSKKTETNKKNEKEEKSKKKEKSEKDDSNKNAKSKQDESKKEKKSSEANTKKTTEKNDSSKKETTTKKENKKSTTKTVSISQVKISKSMNLTKRTGLSRKDFIKLMSGVRADTSGFFEKNAGKIYDLCEKYSINEIFFCGLISAESGWNIASNHRRTHNYISLMRNGKLISYSSVNEGLEVAAQKLHYNYLTPGGKFYHGKTLAGVKTCFCPSSSWIGLVYGRMRQIL